MTPQAPQALPRIEPPQLVIAPQPSQHSGDEPFDEGQLVDLSPLWDFLSLLGAAVQRRPLTAMLGFVTGAVGVVTILGLFPATYHTETRILAQRNLVMPALGNPHRSVPIDSDTPTRSVSETILTRENLLKLIAQLDLQHRWEAELAPIQRLKEMTVGKLRPLSEDQKLDALVGVLEQRIHLSTDEGTVTIGIDWQNPTTAYDLVRLAQDNFLEARHATEVSTIGETITILERHASDARAAMEQALDQIEKARVRVAEDRSTRGEKLAARTRLRTPRVAGADNQNDLADLKTRLEHKRQQIAEIEQERERQMGQLTAQLAQQRAIYAPEHPALVATEQSLKNLSLPPPELATLREDEEDLAEQVQRSMVETRSYRAASARRPVGAAENDDRGSRSEQEDTRLEYPKAQLKIAADNYEDLLRRIDGARIELDTAQAAFKYRYRVIRPAEVPARPAKPRPLLIVAAALFGGLFLALLLVLVLDLRGNLIHSAWQVERRLGVAVFTELDQA